MFTEIKREGFARRGRLHLAHGTVETPVFMPVGTHGVVKTQSAHEIKNFGFEILLGNTYHLYLRPGLEVLKKWKGLHRFMNWDRPILTDSGGFQVFSLAQFKKMSDEGVHFKNHLNGNSIFLTPELAAEIQQVIGSDIAMVLDECVALPSDKKTLNLAVERSAQWAERFLRVNRLPGQKIFVINQGGTDKELRQKSLELSLEVLKKCQGDGLAIGGLSVGEPHDEMIETLSFLAPQLPSHLPHYLMGVGTPRDILESVRQGVDMFDCVIATRNARNGGLFTRNGLLNIRNSTYTLDEKPVEEGCECECCQNYSRSYLRHLFQIKEILGLRLASAHNLYYYHRFLKEIREALEKGQFETYYQEWSPRLKEAYPGKKI